MVYIFKKDEGVEYIDKFNKNKYYSIGFYKTLNMKNIYKYATAVYYCGYNGDICSIENCDKKFKNKKEAYNFYLELIERYKN